MPVKVNSVVFGEIEVDESCVFGMPEGLYGFDAPGSYALIRKQEDDVTLMWYQAIDRRMPCFIVFNPFEIIEGYEPEMERADMRALECENAADLDFLVIAVVPEDVRKLTVNLKSPIAINREKRLARQIILANKDYPIQFSLVE